MIQALAGGAVAVVVLGVVGLWTLEHRTEPGAAALLALLVVLGLLALVAVVGSSDRLAGETALSGAIALWLVAARSPTPAAARPSRPGAVVACSRSRWSRPLRCSAHR